MPPYHADNLYSAIHDDDAVHLTNDHGHVPAGARGSRVPVLPPTDGDVHAVEASSPWPATLTPAAPSVSSHVPRVRVPNVWVIDPSLAQGSTVESKAREAAREVLASSSARAASSYTSDDLASSDASEHVLRFSPENNCVYPSSQSSALSRCSTTSSSSAHHHLPHHTRPAALHTHAHRRYAQHQSTTYDERSFSWLYSNHPSEAPPPAYSPSAADTTTDTTGGSLGSSHATPGSYRTFVATAPLAPRPMGHGRRDEEALGLLAHVPESMASPVDGYPPGAGRGGSPPWRERVRRRVHCCHWRTCRTTVMSLVLLLVASGFLTSFFTSVYNEVSFCLFCLFGCGLPTSSESLPQLTPRSARKYSTPCPG